MFWVIRSIVVGKASFERCIGGAILSVLVLSASIIVVHFLQFKSVATRRCAIRDSWQGGQNLNAFDICCSRPGTLWQRVGDLGVHRLWWLANAADRC
jgi:hypothetical protein